MIAEIIASIERLTRWTPQRLLLGILMLCISYFAIESHHNKSRNENFQDREIQKLKELSDQNDSLQQEILKLERRHTTDLLQLQERYDHEKDSTIRWVQTELNYIRKQHENIRNKMAK